MGKDFTFDQMQELITCVAKNGIGEFLFENGETRLRIRGVQAAPVQMAYAPAVSVPQQAETGATAAVTAATPEAVKQPVAVPAPEIRCITSPIVGTFYSASSPDKEAFAKVGQTIKEGDVVFIVESMKVMNEVLADQSGVVAEILVDNGAPVEYGQTILRLE